MIAALILYGVTVALLLGLAALAAEHLLRLLHRPARFVWIAAMLGAVAFLVVGVARRGETVPTAGAAVVAASDSVIAIGTPTVASSARPVERVESTPNVVRVARVALARFTAIRILVTPTSALARLDRPLAAAWLGCSILGLLVITLSAVRLARPRPRWSESTVDGVPVLVSHDLGPAVVGILRYRIVLPSWALELTPIERSWVLAHEREHASAGDPSLLFLATVLVALCPWNVALWWLARRLRFAIELDCDARVLRTRQDPAAYGALLLAVSERAYGGAMPIVALAEPVSLIERRIAEITRGAPRLAAVRALAAGVVAAAVIVVACATPHPATRPALAVSATAAVDQQQIPRFARDDGRTQGDGRTQADARSGFEQRATEPPAAPVRTAATRAITRPDTAPHVAITPPVVAPITVFDSARPAIPTLQLRTGLLGGPVGPAQTIESIYRVLFDGITLTDDQRSRATDILTRLQAEQAAQIRSTMDTVVASMPKRAAIQVQRDSSLRALISSASDRATFDQRIAPATGERGGGRSGPPPGAAGGRAGGPGRGASEVVMDALYHRLFDGIAMSPENEASARDILQKAQTELRALMPAPQPPRLQLRPQLGLVVMRPEAESELASLLTSDADRATLHSHISTTPIGDLPRQP